MGDRCGTRIVPVHLDWRFVESGQFPLQLLVNCLIYLFFSIGNLKTCFVASPVFEALNDGGDGFNRDVIQFFKRLGKKVEKVFARGGRKSLLPGLSNGISLLPDEQVEAFKVNYIAMSAVVEGIQRLLCEAVRMV